MKYLKLPDLGEGLVEAEIVRWHVKPGDAVIVGQNLVSVETAKAIVVVPSPITGIIAAIFGKIGDILSVGSSLVEFKVGAKKELTVESDAGTIVGKIDKIESILEEDHFIIGGQAESQPGIRCSPAIRDLARRLNVDLRTVSGTGIQGQISAEDVEKAACKVNLFGSLSPLRGVRRAMAVNVTKAGASVVPVSIFDDADIHPWKSGEDPTMRLVRAIGAGVQKEPNLNASYDSSTMIFRVQNRIDLGIAVDTKDGLFVPVLRDITNRDLRDLRSGINSLRNDVKNRSIPVQEMIGPTITLTNFGTIAGRYGTPIILPPMVATIGAGSIRDAVIAYNGEIVIHKILPVSLTFDHRVLTGGEAARFLKALLEDLALPA